MANDRIRKVLRRSRPAPLPPSIEPESTFDAVMEMRFAELQQQVGEIKGRVNSLFFFVLGAAMLQVGLSFVG